MTEGFAIMEATKITAAELAKSLPDVLDRVKHKGERFIVECDGEPLADISPVEPAKSVTFAELFNLLSGLPRPDDKFADDLEAIQASQSVTPPPEWPC